MAVSLVVDDTSLAILFTIIVLLCASVWINRAYQPLIHPLILSRQADVSQVRHKGQSAIYRNANAPVGFELAARPRRGINDVRDAVRLGIGSQSWTFEAKRSLYGEARSNDDFIREATLFGQGLATLAGLSTTSALCLAVCASEDTLQGLEAILSGCLFESRKQRYIPLVINPAYASGTDAPTDLPESISAATLTALYATSDTWRRSIELPFVDASTIIVLPTEELAKEVRTLVKNKIVAFADVLSAARASRLSPSSSVDAQSSITTTRSVEKQNDDQREEVGSREKRLSHTTYWMGRTAGWIEVTDASILSGLTAQLGFYPADGIPTASSHIFAEQSSSLDPVALCLHAASTPAGLALALVSLYTGASFTAGSIFSAPLNNSFELNKVFLQAKPDKIYISPVKASALANALSTSVKHRMFSGAASHAKLAALRHGALSNESLADRLVFRKAREQFGCSQLESLIIVSEGHAVPQALLDALRIHLGCSVMHSYLPIGHLRVHTDHLSAGVGQQVSLNRGAFVTAPISAMHALDLQAFVGDDHNDRSLAAHCGPPSVSLEVKLVETTQAKDYARDCISPNLHTTWDHAVDPVGEIFVRGLALTGHSDPALWCATGDIGTVRSNGTLVILKSSTNASPMTTFSPQQRTDRVQRPLQGDRLKALLTVLCLVLSCVAQASASSSTARSLHIKRASAGINETLVETAITGMLSSQRAPWEHGVAQTALLEMQAGQWSVFAGLDNGAPYRPGKLQPQSAGLSPLLVGMSYNSVRAQDRLGKLCARVTGDENAQEGSALDPAACGDGVLMAAFASGEINGTTAATQGFWIEAASDMLNYLLNIAPRTPSGAISHRSTGAVYWSDGVFMGPPFIALYGLMSNNQTLLQVAFDQCRLYRDALRIPSGDAQGLFRHIVNATGDAGNDSGAWLTGQGWASAGMLRVLATITQSPFNAQMGNQTSNLVSWIEEILDGVYEFANPLMRNYVNDSESFYDTAGSSLIAYSTYRLASIAPDSGAASHVASAEAVYDTIEAQLSPFGFYKAPLQVVDALSFTSPGDTSPESLAFLILLEAARRDYQQKNVTGLQGPSTSSSSNNNAVTALMRGFGLSLTGIGFASTASLLVSLL